METLPPSVTDEFHFAFLADALKIDTPSAPQRPLRLRSFEPAFSWQALADLAEGHGVLYPLIWSLRRRSLLPPPRQPSADANVFADGVGAFDLSYASHLALRLRQQGQLRAAVAILNGSGVQPLLLKGARYLTAEGEDWQQSRNMRDIDLLIPERNADRSLAALRAAGYRDDGGTAVKGKHLPELFHPSYPSAIEVHVDALAHPFEEALSATKIWDLAQDRTFSGTDCKILPDQWQALHCALTHQLTDRGYERCVLALRPLWEFACLMFGANAQTWGAVQAFLDATGLADPLASFALQSQELCGLTLPQGFVVSKTAEENARRTLNRLRSPELLRRASFLIDQARFALSRDTLAYRYDLPRDAVTPATQLRHLSFLLDRYRGNILHRLLGCWR